jgi:hypothetical protein
MRTLTGFIFHLFFMSVSSASIFLASNIIYPVRTVVDRPPVQMPRMRLDFSEFSPAFAALEDDYYMSIYEEEQIPENVLAQQLKPTAQEIIKSEVPEIKIPQMTLRPTDSVETMMNVSGVSLQDMTKMNPDAENPSTATLLAEQQKKFWGPDGVVPHFWIQGKIELTDGLAISDPRNTLAVGWFVDGEKRKDGRISLREGIYEIKVDRLEGELIAELADHRGFLMGEAIIDLEVLAKKRANPGLIIGGVDIKIRPYNFSLAGQTVAIYDSPGNRQVVGRAQGAVGDHEIPLSSNEKGEFVEPLISPQSTGVVAFQQAKYRETVMLANFERELKIHLFPDQFIQAFFETINLPKSNRSDGLIWGTITRGAEPAQGYQVRMVQQNAKPIYFQMYIAHKGSDKTSEDGQYTFVGLNDGEYEIEVIDQLGRLIDSKLAVVRAEKVTELNFEVGEERQLSLRPFDPLSLQPKNIEFFALGQPGVQQVKTEEILKMKSYHGQEPLLIYTKVEGAEIESSTFASRYKKFQEIPVLNESWWKGIQKSYNIAVASGVIVGFADTDQPFEVYIDHQNENTKILYLDQQGKTIHKTAGVKPSGFVIYGIERGLHTLVIESEQGQIVSEAVYVDTEAVSLVYKAM